MQLVTALESVITKGADIISTEPNAVQINAVFEQIVRHLDKLVLIEVERVKF